MVKKKIKTVRCELCSEQTKNVKERACDACKKEYGQLIQVGKVALLKSIDWAHERCVASYSQDVFDRYFDETLEKMQKKLKIVLH